MRNLLSWLLFALVFHLPGAPGTIRASDATTSGDTPPAADVLAGHSYHGEAFNEGPRQKAYLMEGTGKVHFPATTDDPQAQAFIDQGVGQLHGFWYFEAERSFRQAAALDPDCSIAYWGMAMANTNNEKRARGLIAEAVQRKAGVTEREVLYIDALAAYLQAGDTGDPDAAAPKKSDKARRQDYVKALEKILYHAPDDLEAKAFLAVQLWFNRSSGLPITSHLAVDALLKDILQAEPMHPVHHYRIHLWDYERPENALNSAALCGQASPSIAHMWHMPGHIFSRLHRYSDAAWQQEASARVDHAHLMRDRVLPDQIHNFAHNNEWLIRNLIHVGRIHDAIDLAKNMIELPRHPSYNSLTNRGSAYYGRLRLFQVLEAYERWDQLITLCHSAYLEPTGAEPEDAIRLRHLGTAYLRKGDIGRGSALIPVVQAHRLTEEKKKDEASSQAANKAKQAGKNEQEIAEARAAAAKPSENRIRELEKTAAHLEGYLALAHDDYASALVLLEKAGVDAMQLASAQQLAGKPDEAVATAQKFVEAHPNEVQPLANWVDLLWRGGRRDEAAKAFGELREISARVDLDSSVFERLAPIAKELGFPADWRVGQPVPGDVGQRPDLDRLGPFRWRPSPASTWTLKDAEGEPFDSAKRFYGKPHVVIFYLGYGCLHCAEQLKAFAPMTGAFADAGLSLVAISTDDQVGLEMSVKNYDSGAFPFPLVSNEKLDVFKAYRAYDDFEEIPLHGTFLIDAEGLVRWQDISYEPFLDPEFVLKEWRRLGAIVPHEAPPDARAAAVSTRDENSPVGEQ